MVARGLFGFYYNKKYYVVYNYCDAYPHSLGVSLVEEINKAIADGSFGDWLDKVKNLKVIDPSIPPTEKEIKKLKKFASLGVSNQSFTDWFCLLRNCQGSFKKVLEAGYLDNHVNNNGNPRFQDFAYIINYDMNKLDYYYGSEIIKRYNFNELPNWVN